MSHEPAIPIVIEETGTGGARGLADMLRQLLEQTLADSERKRRLAARMRGRAVFRAEEDDSLRIGLVFCGDHISVEDGAREGGSASISADFLSIAGLASGRANPIGLLARRRVRVRFRPRDVPFLFRVLILMRSEKAPFVSRRGFWLTLAGGAIAACVILGWVLQ